MVKKYNFNIRLEELQRIATEWYLDCIFVHSPHFTIHGQDHSLAMESYLNEFLTSNNIELNEYENFLLKAAIWLHDIGMLKRKDVDEDPNEIRKNHHKRSQEIIDSSNGKAIFHLDPHESHIIGVLAYLHRKSVNIQLLNDWYEDCKVTLTYNSSNRIPTKFDIQIDKLAMILRLLDACDRSHMRSFSPEALELAKIPEAAKYHWAHYLISSVKFNKNKIIINSIVPPAEDGKSSKEENIINDLIINDIKREIDSLEWVLKSNNLSSLDVIHKPTRKGTTLIPSEVYEKYLNYRDALRKEGELGARDFAHGYTLRSLDKSVCIYKNRHCIIDIVSDLVVYGEEGITRIAHAFGVDDSSPSEFKFHNLDIIKEVPVTDRFNNQCVFADILNCYGNSEPEANIIEENEVIGNPFKYKQFYLEFSPKLQKDAHIKYGIGLSSPDYFLVDETDRFLQSSHFIRVPTTSFALNLKFEKGLTVKYLNFIVADINNKILIEKELNMPSRNIPTTIIHDGFEGECSYSRENSLYYDTYKFKISNPQIHRSIKMKFKVDIMERTS